MIYIFVRDEVLKKKCDTYPADPSVYMFDKGSVNIIEIEAGKCISMCWGWYEIRECQMSILAANSWRRCVWMQRSQQRWDCNVTSFTETEFIQIFKMLRSTFDYIYQTLPLRFLWKDTWLRKPILLCPQSAISVYTFYQPNSGSAKLWDVDREWCKKSYQICLVCSLCGCIGKMWTGPDSGPHLEVVWATFD